MNFNGHYIDMNAVLFTEYKFPKAIFYFYNDAVFHVVATAEEYAQFLEYLEKEKPND